jgi:peroxiredoxin
MHRWFGVLLLLAGAAFAQQFKLGSQVSDFTVMDLKGAPMTYASLKGGTTVVIFIATRCPVSNSYNQRMNAIYDDYSRKGVKFVFINSNGNEPASEVAQHAREHGLHFAVYKDPGNVVADRFGATVTPEAFVMDAGGTIRYHGYVDDSMNPSRVHNQGLRRALDAVLAGAPPPQAETKAFGCSIKRKHTS